MAKVLVIGGAGGVGTALVSKLLARGDDVTITVLNDKEEAHAREHTPGVSAIHRADLGDSEATKAALDAVCADADFDRVAVCAAISPMGPAETTSLAVVRKTFEINTISHVAIFQAVMPSLRRTKGRLVFISSMAGRFGMQFIGAYTASKFALEGFVASARREVAPQGVSISLVEPGGIKTPMVENQLIEVAQRIKDLKGPEEDLYGYMYRSFETMASTSHNEGGGSTPEQVADIVLKGFDDAKPAKRYIAGDDAAQMIALADSDDDQLDVALAQAFGVPEPVA